MKYAVEFPYGALLVRDRWLSERPIMESDVSRGTVSRKDGGDLPGHLVVSVMTRNRTVPIAVVTVTWASHVGFL